jgi:hypothetical protein
MSALQAVRLLEPKLTPAERVNQIDWDRMAKDLADGGTAVARQLLTPQECDALTSLYAQNGIFRSRIVMARYAFGKGEYQYFSYPLPDLVGELRTALYRHLAPIANGWNERMRINTQYPSEHADYLDICHRAGQKRPTPLLLQYGAGDYCCMHQDLYGDLAFPMQVVILLAEPERDFTGGEFLLVEQNPKGLSKAEVVPLRQGDAVAFAVNHRPAKSARGTARVNLRHGVSRLHSGRRHTLGIIFHDAK